MLKYIKEILKVALPEINSAVNKYYVKQWTDFLKHDKIFL